MGSHARSITTSSAATPRLGASSSRRGRRWWWFVAAGAAIIYLPGWVTLERLTFRQNQLEQTLVRLAQENRVLAEERHQLLTSPQYVEAVARRQLRATRKGEMVLRIEPPATR